MSLECDVTELRGPVRVHLGHKGDTAYLSCPNGFVPSGNQVRTCDSTSKTWDEELFTALPCRQRKIYYYMDFLLLILVGVRVSSSRCSGERFRSF